MSTHLLERALVDGVVHDDVLVTVEGGRFTGVVRDSRVCW